MKSVLCRIEFYSSTRNLSAARERSGSLSKSWPTTGKHQKVPTHNLPQPTQPHKKSTTLCLAMLSSTTSTFKPRGIAAIYSHRLRKYQLVLNIKRKYQLVLNIKKVPTNLCFASQQWCENVCGYRDSMLWVPWLKVPTEVRTAGTIPTNHLSPSCA